MAAGDGTPPRFDTGGSGMGDDAIFLLAGITHADEAAQRRQLIEPVALGDETGGAGFDYLADSLY